MIRSEYVRALEGLRDIGYYKYYDGDVSLLIQQCADIQCLWLDETRRYREFSSEEFMVIDSFAWTLRELLLYRGIDIKLKLEYGKDEYKKATIGRESIVLNTGEEGELSFTNNTWYWLCDIGTLRMCRFIEPLFSISGEDLYASGHGEYFVLAALEPKQYEFMLDNFQNDSVVQTLKPVAMQLLYSESKLRNKEGV